MNLGSLTRPTNLIDPTGRINLISLTGRIDLTNPINRTSPISPTAGGRTAPVRGSVGSWISITGS
jgi:hypothetical protein